jgi:uncharacterized protein (DUF433 family)
LSGVGRVETPATGNTLQLVFIAVVELQSGSCNEIGHGAGDQHFACVGERAFDDVPYPLAHFRPFVGEGRRLVLQAQMISELPPDFWLVVGADANQVLLTPSTEAFLDRVEFAPKGEQWAERIYPAGKDSPVVMDPDRSSGAPTVRGIRTEALVELVDAGEPIDEVADTFALDNETLRAALAYELSRQPAQQPAA